VALTQDISVLWEIEPLELLLAEVLIAQKWSIRYRLSNCGRNANAAGWGELLQALRKRYACSRYGPVGDYNLPQCNSDPQFRINRDVSIRKEGAVVRLKI
jgi:hypothetical protein